MRGAPLIVLLATLSGSPAAADCSGPAWVGTIADAMGTTFSGTFLEEVIEGRNETPYHVWQIDRVYAGDVKEGRYRYNAVSCNPTTYEKGRRYLVSFDDSQNIDAFSTLAWVIAGEQVKLVAFDAPIAKYPRAARDVQTVADAVALLTGGLPPTDAELPGPSGDALPLLPVLAGLLAATAAAAMLRRQRQTAKKGVAEGE